MAVLGEALVILDLITDKPDSNSARVVACLYCYDTGHAGGHLDDPNECGWCDAYGGAKVKVVLNRWGITHYSRPTPPWAR